MYEKIYVCCICKLKKSTLAYTGKARSGINMSIYPFTISIYYQGLQGNLKNFVALLLYN